MDVTDLEVARGATTAAAEAVIAAMTDPVSIDAKSAPTDLVTTADRAGEAAAVAVIEQARPGDGLLGEEGHHRAGDRTWLVDPVDGTLNLVRGLTGWSCVVALQEGSRTEIAFVRDVPASQGFWGLRGEGAWRDSERMRVRDEVGLDAAVVSTYLQPSKRELPGVRAINAALMTGVGAFRAGAGSGSLELAWIADGRLDGWVQPDLAPWDWEPGALLVREAGGRTAELRPHPDGPVWCVAGTPAVCDALVALVEAAARG
jgi:myo-inositol-1(or 4)-monophosphatase